MTINDILNWNTNISYYSGVSEEKPDQHQYLVGNYTSKVSMHTSVFYGIYILCYFYLSCFHSEIVLQFRN